MEVSLDDGGQSLCAWQTTPDIGHHVLVACRAAAPDGVFLDVMVEELIGIQVGTAGGPQNQANLFGMLLAPARHGGGPVNRMAVDDQIDFAPGAARQRLRNSMKTFVVKRRLKIMKRRRRPVPGATGVCPLRP